MGIVKASEEMVTSTVIEPSFTKDTTIMCKGVLRNSKKKKANVTVSNGSIIYIGNDQIALLVDDGRILDYSAEEGYYIVDLYNSPNTYNGNLSNDIKDTFLNIGFSEQLSQYQEIYYINLQTIHDINIDNQKTFSYFDSLHHAEIFIKCFGMYSIKVVDPLKFFMENYSNNKPILDITEINPKTMLQFMWALQSAITQISSDGAEISSVTSDSTKLFQYMSQCLENDWLQIMGIKLTSINVDCITYDSESKRLMSLKRKEPTPSTPPKKVTPPTNTTVDDTPRKLSPSGKNSIKLWVCSCGTYNTGNFCMNCGKLEPSSNVWICSCGTENISNFCTNCGNPKPSVSVWECSCGAKNTGNFCSNCGKSKNDCN